MKKIDPKERISMKSVKSVGHYRATSPQNPMINSVSDISGSQNYGDVRNSYKGAPQFEFQKVSNFVPYI
jgi:hypothetical protein